MNSQMESMFQNLNRRPAENPRGVSGQLSEQLDVINQVIDRLTEISNRLEV